jgi:hypothetical protein
MWDDRAEGSVAQRRQIQGELVDILHHNIGTFFLESLSEGTPAQQGEGIPPADALHVDSLDRRPRFTPRPTGAKQTDPVAALSQPPEQLEKMYLSAACLRVL